MSYLRSLVLALLMLGLAGPALGQAASPEEQAMIKKISAIMDSLHPQYGEVTIREAEAMLHLGKDYYFLPAAEAKRVIVEGWGNPPGCGERARAGVPGGKDLHGRRLGRGDHL